MSFRDHALPVLLAPEANKSNKSNKSNMITNWKPSFFTGRHSYILLSIQRDIITRSRKHSGGTSRRLMRAIRSAKATCFELG